MPRFRLYAVLAVITLTSAAGADVVVQALDGTRSQTGLVSGESFNFVTGPPFAAARAQLSADVSATFLSGVPLATPQALAGVDVFVIGPLTVELSPSEVCALEVFVASGGALLEVRNLGTRPELLGTVPGAAVDDLSPVIVSPSSPLLAGPFGTVTDGLSTGFNYAFADAGGAVVVTVNDEGPNILQLEEGSGRAVLIGDEEIFMTGTFLTERVGKFDAPANKTLLSNTFAWLAGAPGAGGADFCACAVPVEIDIKPGSSQNTVNPKSKGVIPVALLGGPDLNLNTVDIASLAFGPGGAAAEHGGHPADVNGDGYADLMLHFRTQDSGIAAGDTEATLKGALIDGTPIAGADVVRTVGKAGKPIGASAPASWAAVKTERQQ